MGREWCRVGNTLLHFLGKCNIIYRLKNLSDSLKMLLTNFYSHDILNLQTGKIKIIKLLL